MLIARFDHSPYVHDLSFGEPVINESLLKYRTHTRRFMSHQSSSKEAQIASPSAEWPSPYVIAIDGPAGAGKSSVSARLAEALRFLRLDTGALYRGVALAALNASIPPEEGARLDAFLSSFHVRLTEDGSLLLGEALSTDEALRTPEVSKGASDFAKLPAVRARLLDVQRELATRAPCVVDGRDIGTVVFPHAPLKIFLTASATERARRRLIELKERGVEATLEEIKEGIIARDTQDSQRSIAPLKQAEDALLVDATSLSIEEVITRCLDLAREVFPRVALR